MDSDIHSGSTGVDNESKTFRERCVVEEFDEHGFIPISNARDEGNVFSDVWKHYRKLSQAVRSNNADSN